ncbi:HlyD family efflux transporter periplasmic adaptor subunit [Gammaproteobacteria bacterium]|nr:HlyD family efflux transporter periplasmic adaptor subunit [Gammaproteobacteria bacterium]
MRKWLLTLLGLICLFTTFKLLVPTQEADSAGGTITCTLKKTKKQIVFQLSGTASPIENSTITAPVDGNVSRVIKSFGAPVLKGETLIELSSPKTNQDWKDHLVGLIKKRNHFESNKTHFWGLKEMYSEGIISQYDFQKAKSDLLDDYLEYKQSLAMVEKESRWLHFDIHEIESLPKKLVRLSELLSMYHPVYVDAVDTGLWLPSVADKDAKKSLAIGTKVKQGDLLGMIVSKQGFKVNVLVDVQHSQLIKEKDKVSITVPMYPDVHWQGYVKQISIFDVVRQDEGRKLLFPVEIRVDHLTKEDAKKLHFGLSVTCDFAYQDQAGFWVPVKALTQNGDAYFVQVMSQIDRSAKLVPVKVIDTELHEAKISGLIKTGEIILVSD